MGLEFNGFFPHNHPELITQNLGEIEEFARVCYLVIHGVDETESFGKSLHSEVLDPLFVLLAIALELPEDYFTNLHQYPVKSEVGDKHSSSVVCVIDLGN